MPRKRQISKPSSELYAEAIISAAERHGRESEPEHEVADLRAALRACWSAMAPSERERVAADLADAINAWTGE